MPSYKRLLSMLPPHLPGRGSEQHLPRGALLFAQGEKPRAMYCLLSGEVRLVRTSSMGAEIILQRTCAGFVAEASLDQASYHCDARVILPSTVLAIPIAEIRKSLESPRLRDAWITYVSAELRRARAQSERLMLRTARERILHFIDIEGRDRTIKLNITKKAWAAELGLTHEALYRALKSMSDSGELLQDAKGSISVRKGR